MCTPSDDVAQGVEHLIPTDESLGLMHSTLIFIFLDPDMLQ